jgi:hypothetical protein
LRPRDPFSPTNASRDIKPKENQGYYPFGSIWNNNVNGNVWILAGIVNNLANWVLIGNSSGNVITISDNSNTIVNPSPTGNIQFTGQLNENGTPNPFQTIISDPVNHSISINPMSTARWIVDPLGGNDPLRPNGTHTTIASAMSSSVAGDTIFVMPGIYNEIVTLVPGVSLSAYTCDSYTPNVTINGLTQLITAGTCSISGIRFQTNGNFCLAVGGANDSIINAINCDIVGINNSAISNTSTNANSAINLYNCTGDQRVNGHALFINSGLGRIVFNGCKFSNSGGNTLSSICSSGVVNAFYSNFSQPSEFSGTGQGIWKFCDINTVNITCLTLGGGPIQVFTNCDFSSGNATAIVINTTANIANCGISSTNTSAISGLGAISYTGLLFTASSSLMSTTTQFPTSISNDAIVIKSPSAYPYTTVPQDTCILVDTSVARTIIPLAAPHTGQKHFIKDSVGSAAANNITISPSGKTIDGGASKAIANNYGCLEIVYNGTEWNVISSY